MEVDDLTTPADMQEYVAAMERLLTGDISFSRDKAITWMATQMTTKIGENING